MSPLCVFIDMFAPCSLEHKEESVGFMNQKAKLTITNAIIRGCERNREVNVPVNDVIRSTMYDYVPGKPHGTEKKEGYMLLETLRY